MIATSLRRAALLPRLVRSCSSFSAFEQAQWEKSAQAYASTFANVTVQAADALLDGAGVERTAAAGVKTTMTVAPARFALHNEAAMPVPRTELSAELKLPDVPPCSVLDVATGTGLFAKAAAERGATSVVGIDTSPSMIDMCAPIAAAYPGVASFQVGDAEKLPFADASFDAVVMGFVLLHLADPSTALKEAYRVLKPGGSIAYSVWQPPERGGVGFGLVLDAIKACGDPSKALPGTPLPFFHFAEPANAASALSAAGFAASSVRTVTIPCVLPLDDSDGLYGAFASATARTRALLEMQSAEQAQAIQQAVADGVVGFAGPLYQGHSRSTSWLPRAQEIVGTDAPLFDGRPSGRTPYQVPMPCVVASATKP